MHNITIRIDAKIKEMFDGICNKKGSKMSVELRRFIIEFINKNSKK